MPRIGYGQHEWPDVEALVYDASRYRNATEEATRLKHLLGAIASVGSVRISLNAIEAHLGFTLTFDPVTKEYVLRGGSR